MSLKKGHGMSSLTPPNDAVINKISFEVQKTLVIPRGLEYTFLKHFSSLLDFLICGFKFSKNLTPGVHIPTWTMFH
jgi:hypothetical protein